jgi:hypothetical protein
MLLVFQTSVKLQGGENKFPCPTKFEEHLPRHWNMSNSRHRSRPAQEQAQSQAQAQAQHEALPPIAALYVVKFDQREGCEIQKSLSLSQRLSNRREIDTNWSGANHYLIVCAISIRILRKVQYIDLNSRTRRRRRLQIPTLRPPQCQARFGVRFPGPVHVQTALIQCIRYFIHDKHAGISAFVNVPADESQRNAQMLAVGALVPLSYGRLGKSWRHAEGLQELAKYDRKRLVGVWLTQYLQRAHFQRGPSTHAGRVLGEEPHQGRAFSRSRG